MLPPDTTSNLMPWRLMVTVIQMSGCFPYKMLEGGGLPKFSLVLCLWSVFLELFLCTRLSVIYQAISKLYLTHELGIVAFVYLVLINMTVICITPFLVAVKSASLAVLLSDLSRKEGCSPIPILHWCGRPKTIAVLSLFIFLTVFSTIYMTSLEKVHFLEILLIFIASFFYNLLHVLPSQMFSLVFGIIAHRLVVTTDATVVKISTCLAPDRTFICESDVEAALWALDDLDTVIREV